MKMRTSYFGYTKDIESVAAAGYDCIELHIKEIVELDDGAYKAARQKLRDSAVTGEVYDNPLPLDIAIADENFKIDFWTEHVKKAVDRTAEMGARYFVYGNGITRAIPANGDTGKNDEMIAIICDLAAKANITVLLEPLGIERCNRFLSAAEVFDYAKKTGIPNIKTLIDYRWFLAEKHDFKQIEEYADFIQHIHIDNPLFPFTKRLVPTLKDGHDYSPLFNVLKKICYKGIVSIEANPSDHYIEDLHTGIEFLAGHGIEPYRR